MKEMALKRSVAKITIHVVMLLVIVTEAYLVADISNKVLFSVIAVYLFITIFLLFLKPYSHIEGHKLHIYEDLYKKPIILPISQINHVQVSLRGIFPVLFNIQLSNKNEIYQVNAKSFDSHGIEFYKFIKQHLADCVFTESEYVEPEPNGFFEKLLSITIHEKVLISGATIALVLLIVISLILI
jgi:energy-coupling factor transporter transmembrane protein EcfT